MGWTYSEKPYDVKQYFVDKFSWERDNLRYSCLEARIVHFGELYGAVERLDKATGERKVFAVVVLLHFEPQARDGFTFGYKDMSEDMGPYSYDCPQSILEKLTLTTNQYANEWRAKCWNRIATKKGLSDGTVIQFEEPITFSTGNKLDTFKIRKLGRKTRYYPVYPDGSIMAMHHCIGSSLKWRKYRILQEDN